MTPRRIISGLNQYSGIISLGWGILIALFFAFGFRFQTPDSLIKGMDSTVTRNRLESLANTDALDRRIDTNSARLDIQERLIKALAIGQCLDRPKRETVIMQLPCDELLKGETQKP